MANKITFGVGIDDNFSKLGKKIEQSAISLSDKLVQTKTSFNRLSKQDKTVKSFIEIKKRTQQTEQQFQSANKTVSALKREIDSTEKPTKEMSRSFDQAKRTAKKLKDQLKQEAETLQKLRRDLKGSGIDTRSLSRDQRSLAKSIEQTRQKMDSMAKAQDKINKARARYDKSLQRAANISLVAGGMSRVGQGLMGMVANPVQQMRQVERSKGELASLGIDKAGQTQIAKAGRKMSSEIAGVTTAAFVSAAYDIKSGISSLDDKGVADMTGLAALTAKATKSDVNQMTSLFATGYGSFKKSLFKYASDQEFGGILSASLSKAVKQFKTDGSKMQQAIQSMGSGLAESGVSLADQFTALGMLQQKMEAGVAGTTLNALERSAGKAQEKFQKMGLSIETLDSKGNLRAMPDLLEQMQNSFGSEYTTEIGAMIQQAFGSEEAVKFFKALWGQQETFRKNSRAIKEAQQQGDAFTRTMAKAADSNMDSKLQIMGQKWDLVKQKIGNALIPALERLLPVIEWGADKLSEFVTNNKGISTILAGLVGGVGLITVVAAPVVTAIGGVIAAMSFMGLQARKTSAQMMMSNLGGGVGGKLGKRGGLLKKAGGFLKGKGGIAGAALGALAIGSNLMDDNLSSGEKAEAVTKEGGGIAGALSGAAIGAALGSAIPIVGTAIGGITGSIIGGMAGSGIGGWLGGKVKGWFSDDEAAPVANTISNAAKTPVVNQPKVENKNNYAFQIHPTPGMNEQKVADLVMQKIKEYEREQFASLDAALFDGVD